MEAELNKRTILSASLLLFGIGSATALAADVEVRNAWVRGTVAGQQATGAFMEISSRSGATIVGASSPAAAVTEIHEMKMDGQVMRMRAIPRLELPAGKIVQLGPSGYRVMLIRVKPLLKGESVPLTLQIEGKDRKIETVEVKAEVRELTAAASPAGEHQH